MGELGGFWFPAPIIDESWDYVRECISIVLLAGTPVAFAGDRIPPRWVNDVDARRTWVSAKAEGFASYAETAEELFTQCGYGRGSRWFRFKQYLDELTAGDR